MCEWFFAVCVGLFAERRRKKSKGSSWTVPQINGRSVAKKRVVVNFSRPATPFDSPSLTAWLLVGDFGGRELGRELHAAFGGRAVATAARLARSCLLVLRRTLGRLLARRTL